MLEQYGTDLYRSSYMLARIALIVSLPLRSISQMDYTVLVLPLPLVEAHKVYFIPLSQCLQPWNLLHIRGSSLGRDWWLDSCPLINSWVKSGTEASWGHCCSIWQLKVSELLTYFSVRIVWAEGRQRKVVRSVFLSKRYLKKLIAVISLTACSSAWL